LFSVFAEESKEKDRLAVMDVQDKDSLFNQKTRGNITDYIFGKLAGTKLYWMIPKSDRDTALEQTIEKTKQDSRKECVDEKCQLSLVAELQANFLINTEIKKLFESTCLISIKKFDVEKRAGTDAFESKFNCTEKGAYEAIDSLNVGGNKESAEFKTGKMGKLEDEWNPDMAGSGEQAVVYFESEPQGATVSIDENVVGKTPDFKSKMLASGKHQIKMEKEGFYTETKILDLKKGNPVKFKLFPGIKINSNPSGATVRIDGKMLCESTPCEKVVDEGEREIIVQKDLYSTKKQIISVQRGNNIQVDLEPNFGWLEIESKYDGVDVVLDGKNIGKTPIQKRQITPGAHLIEPQGECFNTVPEQFVAEKGKTHTINLGVQQKEGAIQVTAKDDKGNDLEADVFVDGKNIGTAPGTFKVSMCSKVVAVKTKKGEVKQSLKLREKQVSKIDAVLDPSFGNWSKKSTNKMAWYNAKEYCDNLTENGYSDWRMPTISELRTLIKNCPATETGGKCKVDNDCLLTTCWSDVCQCSNSSDGRYSKLRNTEELWSSSSSVDIELNSWSVNFGSGSMDYYGKVNNLNVRCVREEQIKSISNQQKEIILKPSVGNMSENSFTKLIPSNVVKTDSKSMENRDKAIDQLNELIKDYPEGSRKAEVYRRMAELYWEKAQGIKTEIINAGQTEFKASWEWNNKAIDVCDYIIKKYPDFQNIDEVYFFMASNLMEVGQPLRAVRYYTLVVEKYANSKFVAEAFFEMAEYFFTNNNFFKAIANYKANLDRPSNNKFYGVALIRYAECFYNVGEKEQAKQFAAKARKYFENNKEALFYIEEFEKRIGEK